MRTSSPSLLALILAFTACSSGGGGGGPDPFATPREDRIFIEVENRNFDRATIWYETRSRRQRLGAVEGKTNQTFTVQNWPVSAPIFLEVHLTAGQTCRTPELQADPGDNLYLEVPASAVAGAC